MQELGLVDNKRHVRVNRGQGSSNNASKVAIDGSCMSQLDPRELARSVFLCESPTLKLC